MQKQQQILNCQLDRHFQSPIIGVCVNKECLGKRPSCVGCQYQFHSTHLQDFKNFGDLKNWLGSNSKIVEDLNNYLKELKELIKQISQLIEATQQGNNQNNFQEMNYTDLNNSINKIINLWNHQTNLRNLLKEIFSIKARNKIKDFCSQQQSNVYLKIDSNIINQQNSKIIDSKQAQQVFFVQPKLYNDRLFNPSLCSPYLDSTKSQKSFEKIKEDNKVPQQNYQTNPIETKNQISYRSSSIHNSQPARQKIQRTNTENTSFLEVDTSEVKLSSRLRNIIPSRGSLKQSTAFSPKS